MEDFRTYSLSDKEKLSLIGRGYVVIAAIIYLFYKSLILSAISGLLVVFLLKPYSAMMKEKRDKEILSQFKDFLVSLSFALETGRQMQEAMEEGFVNLKRIYGQPRYLTKSVEFILREMRDSHVSEKELLSELAIKTDLEDVKNFVQVYLVAVDTGGNLKQIINNSIEVILDKMAIVKEIETLMAQRFFELRVISLMPFFVIIFFNIFNGEYIRPLYETLMGRGIMTVSLGGIVLAYHLGKKIMDVKV